MLSSSISLRVAWPPHLYSIQGIYRRRIYSGVGIEGDFSKKEGEVGGVSIRKKHVEVVLSRYSSRGRSSIPRRYISSTEDLC